MHKNCFHKYYDVESLVIIHHLIKMVPIDILLMVRRTIQKHNTTQQTKKTPFRVKSVQYNPKNTKIAKKKMSIQERKKKIKKRIKTNHPDRHY